MRELCVGEQYTVTAYRTITYWKKQLSICALASEFHRFKVEHKELEYELATASSSNMISTNTDTPATATTYTLAVSVKFRLLGFKKVRYDSHNYKTIPQLVILRE
jgi:hypothetical protein